MQNQIIDDYGNKFWYVDDKLHCLDGPAVEGSNGTRSWWVDGKPHRLDGPAYEYANGTKAWFINGKKYRLDGPAIEYADGDKSWFVNDERLSGPLDLLKHGAKIQDIAEYLTPREIVKTLDKQ